MEDQPVVRQYRRRRHRRRPRIEDPAQLPNLFFCGDPHGGFDQVNEAARLYKPDAMILLGDLQLTDPLEVILEEALAHTDIFWIPGNHDTDCDQYYDNLWRSQLGSHNLHGRVINVHGLRIAGLGGVFRGQVWMPDGQPNYPTPSSLMRRLGPSNSWRGGIPRRHRTTIFPSVYRYLMGHKADILVTHEAPGCHVRGFEVLDELARTMGVRWMFHGHQHEDRVYSDNEGIPTRAVGYRGVVNLQGEVVIPAQLDPREAADLELAFEHQDKALAAGEAILVRDIEGKVAVVPANETLDPGTEPAILPCSPDITEALERQAREKARRLGEEVAQRAPGGRWCKPRPKQTKGSNPAKNCCRKDDRKPNCLRNNHKGEKPKALAKPTETPSEKAA